MTFPSNGTWLSTTEFALCITFISICLTLVCLRLWSRTIQRGRGILQLKAFTLSDLFLVIGFLSTFGNTACDIAAVIAGGSGRHVSNVTREEDQTGQKSMFTAAFFWLTATTTLKISILFLYVEIFSSSSSRRTKFIAWGMIGLVGSFFIAFLFTIFFQCTPFSMNWIKDEKGHCVNMIAESRAGAFINVIFDVMITIFPIPLIWPLQMPVRKRIYMIILFGLGSAADGVNISRAIIAMNPSAKDYTYFSAKTNILAATELWLGCIIACLPTLKPAVSRLRLHISAFGTKQSSRFKSTKYSNGPRLDEESGRSGSASDKSGKIVVVANERSPSAGVDPWERQYKYLSDDEDDESAVVLTELGQRGVGTTTTVRGTQPVSPASSRQSSNDFIKVRSDLRVYETTYSHGRDTSREAPMKTPVENGVQMV